MLGLESNSAKCVYELDDNRSIDSIYQSWEASLESKCYLCGVTDALWAAFVIAAPSETQRLHCTLSMLQLVAEAGNLHHVRFSCCGCDCV